MDPERLRTIDDVFNSVLELSPADRESFLSEACKNDPDLRIEVESLLSFESISDHFIDAPPAAIAAEIFEDARPPENLIGSSIGHYSIIKVLGKGGMGEVYLAEDSRLGRKVALKLIPEVYAGDKDRLARFILEARSASTLNHPNIITIHEIGEADGSHFMATEYIEGITLKEFIENGPPSIRTALDVGVQLASALVEAHKAGIIHRDIKPENVMRRPDGLVKILDFGVAKFAEPERTDLDSSDSRGKNSAGTLPGMIIGTAEYMSPEQARGVTIDTRSDIFSFGSLMYELFSGRKAFSGENTMDTIGAVLHKEAVPISEFVPMLPATVSGAIDACLAKSANERPQHVEEVLEVLRSARRRIDFDAIENGEPKNDLPRDIGNSTSRVTGKAAVTTQSAAMSPASTLMVPSRGLRSFKGWLWLPFVVVGVAVFGYLVNRSISTERQISSIAVMPFANQSGDASVDYLSDGVTENLISSLSIIPGLSVKARNTVFTYKGRVLSPDEIGQELKVDSVLFGTLVQKGEDIRVGIELVDTSSQNILWTESYSRKLVDLVSLQREIARDVSDQLKTKLSASERRTLTNNYPTNSEAQQLYLKGRFHWNKRTSNDLEKAAEFFSQAIEKDPEFALAHSGLANAYALMPLYGRHRPSDFISKAKQAALRSLEIDPDLAEAHASLGWIVQTYDFDWAGAEREFKTAIRLNPNYATAHQWYAEHLAFQGSTDRALAKISDALELDPFSLVINRMKGNVLGFSGRHDEAIVHFNKTLELYPDNPSIKFNLGDSYAAKGMRKEAIEHYLVALELSGLDAVEISELRNASVGGGWDGFWKTYLDQLLRTRDDLIAADPNAYIKNESIALAYAATSNKDMTIEYLNRAYMERDPHLVTIRMSEVYEFLNDDPRYHDLLKNIGLNY